MILLRAYVRRRRFEARLLAGELAKLFGGRAATGSATGGRVSADEMMQMMGITF